MVNRNWKVVAEKTGKSETGKLETGKLIAEKYGGI